MEPASSSPPPSSRRAVLASLLIGVVLVAAILVAAAVFAGGPQSGGIAPVSGPEDRPMPDMSLDTLDADGGVLRLEDYRGVPLVVNFWATWCEPCLREMPDFEEFSRRHRGSVALLGVNVQDNRAAAQRFADELGVSYDLAFDPAGALFAELRARVMPTTLFVDAGGVVRYRYGGELDASRLRTLVEEHLDVVLDEVPDGNPAETQAP